VSLFRAHFERQPGDPEHDDSVPLVDAVPAERAPRFAPNAHSAGGTAITQRDALGVDERLGSDPRPQPARDPDPERRLAELDRDPDEDRQDPEVPRQDEDRQK
jgi:hypothetical protein